MMVNLCFVLCFIFENAVSTQNIIGTGLRCENAKKSGCCTNYQLVDGSCVRTFGDNCSGGPCLAGYYGFGCLRKCNCLKQQCDRLRGCTNQTEVENSTDTEFPWYLLVGLLNGIIIFLVVSLLAVVYKRKMRSHRVHQQDSVIPDTGNESVCHALVENGTYLECTHTEISEGSLKHKQLEENKTNETGSGHYLSINPRPPSNADVWKCIKETVEKNRERNSMLRLLSRGSTPPLCKSQRFSYVSVIEEQCSSCDKS